MPARSALLLLILGVGLAVNAAGADARDFEEEGRIRDAEALVARLEALGEAQDKRALTKALAEVAALHNTLKTKTWLSKLQRAVGAVVKDKDLGVVVRMGAVDTLASLFDEKGVFKELKPFIPQARDETVGQVGLSVLKALAKIQADGAISALQDLARSARDVGAAQLAIAALGQYSYSKKRAKILKFLIQEVTRLRPGVARDVRGRRSTERYIALRDSLVRALNALTRRNLEGVEPWLELYKANKKTPEKLFRTRR